MAPHKEINTIPPRLYVVGDIHGCHTEVELLYNHLKSSEKLTSEDLLCFIGDYIDRGPDSQQVIDLMLNVRREFPNTIFLKGNHEDMLLNFLGYEGTNGYSYLQNGGMVTLQSYEIPVPNDHEQVRRRLPPQHLEFFRTLDNFVVCGDYILVHAGLHPLKDLDKQQYEDIFWIRDEFIQNIHKFEKTVVFGHTPYWDVLFHLPYKIGIDTGLVYGNKLSCVELIGKRLLQVKKGEISVKGLSFEQAMAQQEKRVKESTEE